MINSTQRYKVNTWQSLYWENPALVCNKEWYVCALFTTVHYMKKIQLFLLLFVSISSCDFGIYPSGSDSEHLALGNPSMSNTKDPNNYILIKKQYVVSYNRSKLIPNWVAWHLDDSWIKDNIEREGSFSIDESLPQKWKKAMPSQYLRSGFDRGHLCPAADRTRTVADQEATFIMTNIIPQAPMLNRGLWADIEKQCRSLVRNGNELYVYSGTNGLGGTGENGYADLLIGGVVVPGYVWKVIVVLPDGSRDVSRIDQNTQVITLLIPNKDESNYEDMDDFVVSLKELESKTKLSFLPANYGVDLVKQKKFNFEGELKPKTDSPCGVYNAKTTYKGSRGGCYYLSTDGKKTYVDKKFCNC